MESKVVVSALFIVALASSSMLHAQQSIRLTPVNGVNTAKPDAFVVPNMVDVKTDDWKDQQRVVDEPSRFAKMFQTQAAEAGDPRRVPLYLLIPFARGGNQSNSVDLAAGPKNPANQPSVVKDVGALISLLQTNH